MKLYNTATRTVEPLTAQPAQQIGLYACGPTVYDYTHLGHLRKYTMDDILVRVLRHAGFSVTFVQNITDVGHLSSDGDTGEDKLEKGAKKYQQSVWDIAKRFEEYYWRSMELMGNVKPDVSCRATEHIAQQLEMVKELEKRGHTYVIEGDGVYFDTSTFSDYGKMARLNLAEQQAGARVEQVSGKRSATDFALWKFEREGEDRAMVWESPWHQRSFPGWHIECSAMAMEYLGNQFEIHTGGIDHIPVHHTNEIAQAEAATGKSPFVKYWVHHNFLQVEGEKMAKSAGNFFTIDDVLEKGYAPQALRLLFLSSHYRSEMNFTWEALAAAQTGWDRLLSKVSAWQTADVTDQLSNTAQKLQQQFWQHLEDDLHSAEALAVLWEVVKSDSLSENEKLQLVTDFDAGLGLDVLVHAGAQSENMVIPSEVQQLLDKREQARADKDWQRADQLRDQILEAGFQVEDTAQGQVVRVI